MFKLPAHSEIQTAHKLMRETVRQRRQRLNAHQQQQASVQVCRHLEQMERVGAAKNIALFLSFDGELNTQPIINQFWQQNKSVYLPVLHPFSDGNLLFLRYTPQTKLILHRFGLKQPPLDVRNVIPVSELDIIFTPLVAFDDKGNRLGMGKGYYDRMLQNWRQKNIYPIGLAHDCQHVAHIDSEAWDIPLPEIITPSKRWVFNASANQII